MTTLGKLPSLNYLYLNLTPITDVGLKNLRGANGLETLHLRSTDVTQEGRRLDFRRTPQSSRDCPAQQLSE